jgi:hypothetical protein
MRTSVFLVLATLIVMFGIPADAVAQGPSGMVTFSGPGATLLPSTTFEPATYEGTPGTWGFLDQPGAVVIVVTEVETDPTQAAFVSVGEEGGETWTAVSIFGPILGVEIDGDTIKFADVSVPQSGSTNPQGLILNGSLTRGIQVDVESPSVSSIKRQYSDVQR